MRLKFIPREKAFFGLFARASANLVEGARLFKGMLESYGDPKAAHKAIDEVEHAGDDITHEIIRTLNTTFVTPLDREDIHALASGIDDVLDFIEAAADMFGLHAIEKPTPEAVAQAGVLLQACEIVNDAVSQLERFKGLDTLLTQVHEIENQGDKLYRRAVADLYSGDYKALEVLRWKEIYEQVEEAVDACEKIASTLEAIVLKNA